MTENYGAKRINHQTAIGTETETGSQPSVPAPSLPDRRHLSSPILMTSEGHCRHPPTFPKVLILCILFNQTYFRENPRHL